MIIFCIIITKYKISESFNDTLILNQNNYINSTKLINFDKFESKIKYTADIAVIICSYKRVNNMSQIINNLQKQSIPIDIYIWNNNINLKYDLNKVCAVSLLKYNIYIHHSKYNIYPIARFILARQLRNKYTYFIFLDDDQLLNSNSIKQLKDDISKFSNTIVGYHGKKILSKTSYWNRKTVKPYEYADYIGTAGMIAPSYIFTDQLLQDIPIEYRKIEDFWLNVYFIYYYGGSLRKSKMPLKLIPDWKKNALNLETRQFSRNKNNFLVYLINNYNYDKYLDTKNHIYNVISIQTPYVSLDKYINTDKLNRLGKYLYMSPKFKKMTDNVRFHNIHKKATKTKQINVTEPNFIQNFKNYHYNKRYKKYYNETKYYTDIEYLKEFIESLPFFKEIGFIRIWVDYTGNMGSAHIDHSYKDLKDEFVWLCPYGYKKLYVKRNGRKEYIQDNHKCIWFNTQQLHGIDYTGKFSISIRIDGIFTDEFRKIIIKN